MGIFKKIGKVFKSLTTIYNLVSLKTVGRVLNGEGEQILDEIEKNVIKPYSSHENWNSRAPEKQLFPGVPSAKGTTLPLNHPYLKTITIN